MTLHHLTEAEWVKREEHGLPKYHSLNVTDLGFKYTDPASQLLFEKETPSTRSTRAFLSGEYDLYEQLMRFAYAHVASCCIFNKDFMKHIKRTDETYDKLPEVHTVVPLDGVDRAAFISCDGNYLEKFGQWLVKSIDNDLPIMLHIMDPEYNHMVLAKKLCDEGNIGLQLEYPEAGPGYYHSVRLIRFKEFLKKQAGILLDVDTLARNPISQLPEVPLGVRLRPARLEPWNQFNASVIVGNWQAEAYFNMVANYIYQFYLGKKLLWGIDQAALFSVWVDLQNNVTCLDEKEVDYDYHDDGIIWNNSGKQKFQEKDLTRQKYRDYLEEIRERNMEHKNG